MTDSNLRPYPGYNPRGEDESPRPNARVKPEGEEFANRGRGSLDLFASTPRVIPTSAREPRCPGNEARQNYEVGRHGTVNKLLYGQATPRNDEPAMPRVKDEARPIADGHQGKATSQLFNSYGTLPNDTPRALRVKPEAENTAELHQGGTMKNLMHDPKKLPSSARAAPRVKGEASANADLGRGGQMNKTIHSYGSNSSRMDYHARVKPEASENAEKGKGYMGTLMGKYGKLPLDEQPSQKVRGAGGDNASLDQGGRMSRLMHEGSNLPQDPRPIPRANSKEAKTILRANRGQIGKLFAEAGKHQTVSKAGTRSVPSLKVY